MDSEIRGFQFDVFRIDLDRRVLLRKDEVIDFGGKNDVWDLLVYLAEHSTGAVPEAAVLELFWPERAETAHKINRLKNLFYRLKQIFPEAAEMIIWRGHVIKWTVTVSPIQTDRGREITVEPKQRSMRAWIWVAVLVIAGFGSLFLLVQKKHMESIVVLPFANGGGEQIENLSLGMAEQVINRLTRVPNLRVMARSTAFTFRAPQNDPGKIGRDLGVRMVMTGRVTKTGEDLDVQVDLIDASSGSQIWGERYARKMADVQRVPEEIARAVADKMQVKLTRDNSRRLAAYSAVNPEAYELYLYGNQAISDMTPDRVRKSKVYFQQAIARDANYAEAYAGLANSYNYMALLEMEAPKDVMPLAKHAAQRALELDRETSEAYTALGIVQSTYEWDWVGSAKQFQRGLELNPGGAYEQHWYGHYLESVGRWEEAQNQMQKAASLDPLNPMPMEDLGYDLIVNRHYDDAVQQLRRLTVLNPQEPLAHVLLALALEAKGLREDSLSENNRARQLSGDSIWATGFIGGVYCRLGRPEEARQMLAELEKIGKKRYVSPLEPAMIHFALGEKQEGFRLLDLAVEDRSVNLQYYVADRVFDSVRNDPRLIAVRKKLGLVEAAWAMSK